MKPEVESLWGRQRKQRGSIRVYLSYVIIKHKQFVPSIDCCSSWHNDWYLVTATGKYDQPPPLFLFLSLYHLLFRSRRQTFVHLFCSLLLMLEIRIYLEIQVCNSWINVWFYFLQTTLHSNCTYEIPAHKLQLQLTHQYKKIKHKLICVYM